MRKRACDHYSSNTMFLHVLRFRRSFLYIFYSRVVCSRHQSWSDAMYITLKENRKNVSKMSREEKITGARQAIRLYI